MSRRTGEAGGVLSFTFLDVLTCTMGSLVLLVVVLGQRGREVRLEEALKHRGKNPHVETPAPAQQETDVSTNITAEQAQAKLAELRKQKAKLDKIRAEAIARAGEEQARVSHLEEHERRLEHELAQLHIAMERLEETEGKQTVDQKTAESELKRLKKLVVDTEGQLKDLRTQTSKKSYAIVPYKGANGTFRRPIYIECTKEAVTIQPEGIRLNAIDFDGPIRSGNPLAAAMRAAREELNARARAAGATDLPDPYPLLIVRPDGANAYAVAVSAISAWDADYGYEFVASDWKLQFPEVDPNLNQVMFHAVEQARERQAMLAKVAPRRYGSRLVASGQGSGGGAGSQGGEGDGGGFDVITGGGAGDRIGQRVNNGLIASGNGGGHRGGSSGSGKSSGGKDEDFAASVANENRYGQAQGNGGGGPGSNFANAPAESPLASNEPLSVKSADGKTQANGSSKSGPGEAASSSGKDEAQMADALKATPSDSSGKSSGQGGEGNGNGGPNATGAPGAGGGGSAMASASSGGANAANGGGPSAPTVQVGSSRDAHSAAEKRGANWANAEASRRASPITRPIQVTVRPDQIDVASDEAGTAAQKPAVISFHQPTERVLDDLAAAVQQHIKDWGLAGQGMYWRPTLVLQVAPGADRHAIRLNDLLKDSGVDVHFKDVASKPEDPSHATR
jgi:hypothetical protein